MASNLYEERENILQYPQIILEAVLGKPQKKVHFLVVRPLRRGGGKGPTTKEKRTFFLYFSLKFLWPLSRGMWGGVGKGLSGRTTKKRTFILGLPLLNISL